MLWVAQGRLDLYLAPRPKIWDYAAGHALVRQAGLDVRFFPSQGTDTGLVCGQPSLMAEWAELAAVHDLAAVPDLASAAEPAVGR
jgi:fructose-1,6-bisphosphatase/inositol monophosphatase family enzyme